VDANWESSPNPTTTAVAVIDVDVSEDTGPINEEDEIYAVAMFRDGDGGERIQYSQKIVRYFEAPGTCTYTCST
jgi:hypothetical protein